MPGVTLTLYVRKRWFFYPALAIIVVALKLGLIPDRRSDTHWGGIEHGADRAARWLAEKAMHAEVI